MSNTAEILLAQYYGLPVKTEDENESLSIYESVSGIESDADKLIGHESTIDIDSEDASKDVEVQENDVESEKKDLEDDSPVRSSRALNLEALEDDETSSEFDIIFDTDATGNLLENINGLPDKETLDVNFPSNKVTSTTLGLEDNGKNDSYLSLSEDVSDVSSVIGKKKSKESLNMFTTRPSTPPLNKTPIYNETFIDLKNARLTSFPIELAGKYPTIQMLYLENNDLSELPEELFLFLPQLQWLDIRNNQLTTLPSTIKSHPSLETILLQENKIVTLPLELCLVPNLKILNIAQNPIATPPKDIVALGCSGILSYLRAEWNKLHPEEPATFVKAKIEPKLSTILCYQSPRERRRRTKMPWRESKSTSDIGNLFNSTAIKQKTQVYKASNRYANRTQTKAFVKNSVNVLRDETQDNTMDDLCASCAEKINVARCDESDKRKNGRKEYDRKESETDDIGNDKQDGGQHAFLKIITSCQDVKNSCIKQEIADVDEKILRLTGPSSRSCYVRRNVTGLITYRHYRERECRIKAISNETKHIALTKPESFTALGEKRKKCRDTPKELTFDIITKDMRRMQLRPMQLKDSRNMLLCLEKYLGVSS